ncbi:complement C1q-like protein 2 [Megalops cyprinoides]|uniref:complement C1q-like protein 2 n=1 Tax=Megalops cyprinoides TaxID=118141 RepID=UPI001863CAEC|nr:complement C1q-like protein 2 [Megalops cyprinoides]
MTAHQILLLCLFVGTALGQTDEQAKKMALAMQDSCSQNTLSSQLCRLEARVEQLERELKDFPQVAFSAALRESGSGNIGPFAIDTVLQYKKIFSNIGNCYNPSTGIFTARVRGAYYFRFSAFNNIDGTPSTNVVLMKNDMRTVSIWDKSPSDTNDSASNAVVLQLEEGDSVFVRLPANNRVFDDMGYYNSFSGFLLFPM